VADQRDQLLIKEYLYWILSLHPKQHTLGCVLLTCKRILAEKISDLTYEEWAELQQVMREYEVAVEHLREFRPVRTNYYQL
jgi:diadenosine tetraphosphate (Ap4A) HIT family hydrolase